MSKNDVGVTLAAITAISAVVVEVFGGRFSELWVIFIVILLFWGWK